MLIKVLQRVKCKTVPRVQLNLIIVNSELSDDQIGDKEICASVKTSQLKASC